VPLSTQSPGTVNRSPGALPWSSLPNDRALLDGAPPEAALAWVAAAVDPASRVVSVRRLHSFSSAVHALLVLDRRQAPHELVLRRYVRREWLRREPDLAEREAQVLSLLEATAVPAPRLIACDPHGDRAGVPAVLMSRIGGRPRRRIREVGLFTLRLAEALVRVHSVSLPADALAMVRRYRPHNLHLPCHVPEWALRPCVWERALELYSGPTPNGAGSVLLHRDYHPGNVLWQGDSVSGVVDWANASVGGADADLGHCRMVLALWSGQEPADRFLRAYAAVSGSGGQGYHPYWDLVAAVGVLPDVTLTSAQAARLDRFVSRAVAQLG
jgi:aminoglycoside phosphotransferase (APT) family kinase protein